MIKTKEICYFDFLTYCLDGEKHIPERSSDIDWYEMLFWAEQQAIIGVVFEGIQKAGKSLKIPTDILFKWI